MNIGFIYGTMQQYDPHAMFTVSNNTNYIAKGYLHTTLLVSLSIDEVDAAAGN